MCPMYVLVLSLDCVWTVVLFDIRSSSVQWVHRGSPACSMTHA